MEQNKKSKSHLGGKVTPSARLYVSLGFASAVAAAVVITACYVAHFVDADAGLEAFGTLFYALVILIALSLTLSINQLLRGKSAFAVAALTISSLSLIAAIVTIILEFVFYDTFFLIPFTPFA